jgi:hypothetical protein
MGNVCVRVLIGDIVAMHEAKVVEHGGEGGAYKGSLEPKDMGAVAKYVDIGTLVPDGGKVWTYYMAAESYYDPPRKVGAA